MRVSFFMLVISVPLRGVLWWQRVAEVVARSSNGLRR